MKKIILAAVLSAAAFPALAQGAYQTAPVQGYLRGEPQTTGSLGNVPAPAPRSSADIISTDPAADGNANLLTRPSPNYGNVSGGYVSE
jgi:hypothetical protein